ncbi:hypothetical protein [Dellaglioa algida]|uniref:hypothetical protein n=1 Tax=Dellaglioa algida TaxID=105612 RepID=UPI0024C4BB01|nr:hypothetical protein [Dellaglioa algida]MDK1726862.1 hypothetical protein [Dellaglioa algida]
MLKNNCTKLPIIHKSIIILCFGLLFLLLPVYNTQAATAYAPPKGYPMGAATDTTGFAGRTITFNSNEIYSLQGQFFAKTFTSSGQSGNVTGDNPQIPPRYLQNYDHDPLAGLTDADFDKVSPPMISENISGADIIAWYANKNSFIFSKTNGKAKNLSYYIETSPSDDAIAKAVTQQSGITPTSPEYAAAINLFNSKKDKTSSLAGFPNMKNNGITSFNDATQNVIDVSDYYANFTSTNYSNSKAKGDTTKYNDAIKNADLNTNKLVKAGDSSAHVIQLTINMNTQSKDQGVVFADIDGNVPHFEDATAISINLVNFNVKTMKMPFIVLNYKHFSNDSSGISFNFNNGTWMTCNAYPPASDGSSINYKLDGNSKGTLFTGQNSNGADKPATDLLTQNLTPIDPTGKKPEKVKSVFNTSSHIINNFNTENGKIFIGNPKSSLYGSVLAPSADVDINADQGILYGSIITGQNIIGNLNVPGDMAYQSIFNASDDFGDDSIQDFLKNPDSVNSTHPTIKSISLPGYTSIDTGSGTTHYIPQVEPYDFHFSLNNITAELPEHTVQTSKKSFDTTINVDTKSTPAKTEKYYLWYSFNNGPWEKYVQDGTTELTSSKLGITGNVADKLAKTYSTKHSKYKYDEVAYTNSATYDKASDPNQVIGYHLFHKNRISYLVTSTTDTDTHSKYNDKTINELLGGASGTILSASDLAEINPDYTPISYNLHVIGDLLVSYPKIFNFGNFTAGTSVATPKLTATGLLTVDNPFGLKWDLAVGTKDTDNPKNPFFIPDQLSWFEKRQTSPLGNSTITYGNASNLTTIKSKDTIFDLNSSIFGSDTTSIINNNYYSAQIALNLQTNKITHPGNFKDNVTWSITSPKIPVDPSQE